MFTILIWCGAALTLGGLALLLWCILQVAKARRTTTEDAEMRVLLQKLVPVNLGALALSALGLMLLAVGLALG
ncbi:hypothetical protein E4Z66_00450 [Aliishimia ponticola]|uniref:Uncharacterized protein n=1 Tax=Aliishimia ponticola TaxID=2499833 RepID=A0A4S4NHJ8_9RHOB|nr:hypothetical protein E4Z66_00450 [Aliishimia ponticola]